MDTPDTKHTPASLRVRLAKKLREVAEESGVSERTLRDLEDGKDVSLDTIRRVAPVLGVTADQLIAAIDTERARRAGTAA